ncbi:MAG: hypothetical protein ACXITV_10170 [Luteibaculaceae bacterium]
MKNFAVLILFLVFGKSYAQESEKHLERKLDSKSSFLTISTGFAFTATFVDDPNNFLENGSISMNNHRFLNIRYEKGIKHNFFVEGSYETGRIGINTRISRGNNENTDVYVRLVDNSLNHMLELGGGYRLIGRNEFHYLNFHFGFFGGFIGSPAKDFNELLDFNRTIGDFDINSGKRYDINITIQEASRISFGTYVGVSHQVRISQNLNLFFMYNQRFGFISNIKGAYEFSENLNLSEPASFTINGRGAFLSGGLRITLSNHKLH